MKNVIKNNMGSTEADFYLLALSIVQCMTHFGLLLPAKLILMTSNYPECSLLSMDTSYMRVSKPALRDIQDGRKNVRLCLCDMIPYGLSPRDKLGKVVHVTNVPVLPKGWPGGGGWIQPATRFHPDTCEL